RLSERWFRHQVADQVEKERKEDVKEVSGAPEHVEKHIPGVGLERIVQVANMEIVDHQIGEKEADRDRQEPAPPEQVLLSLKTHETQQGLPVPRPCPWRRRDVHE